VGRTTLCLRPNLLSFAISNIGLGCLNETVYVSHSTKTRYTKISRQANPRCGGPYVVAEILTSSSCLGPTQQRSAGYRGNFPPRSSYKAHSLPPFKNSLITLACEILQVGAGTSGLYSFAPHCKALGGMKKGEVK
jgi:hypothetical protein